ncbi:major facilitator superfamily domain-containing protein [Phthorimaea operculella]|nr:major facilitator superfamily domain-containing protein [Phthorimaea operculella]
MEGVQDRNVGVKVAVNPMQKLEDALVICKFGWFNVHLMVASFLSVLATTAVTTGTSFILPSAECDLSMDLRQKGLLNAIPFLGQFCAALFAGFITDAFGRKIFLVGGNMVMFCFAIFGASSQTYSMLLVGKLFEGIAMSLVFTATATMITEFTHKNIRDRVLVFYMAFMSISIILAALLSWAILPQALRFVLFQEYFVINSWNIYLYANASWSLLAAVLYWYLPESPKFVLSHGNEKKALKILKKMYRINTGKPEETFPMSSLNVPGGYSATGHMSVKKKINNALFDMKELYRPPLIFRLLLFAVITCVCLLSYSALRLWFPQLSTSIENYKSEHEGQTDWFCVMMDSNLPRNKEVISSSTINNNTTETICIPHLAGAETYINSVLLGLVSLVAISCSGYLVHFLGQKPLMFLFFIMCTVCSSALYWAKSAIVIAVLISATCGFMQAAFSLQHNILARVFPTTVRTMAMSVVMVAGRAGSLVGNILFPIMLELGCMVPFVTLSAVTLAVAGLVYFLPNPRKENSGTGDK